MNKEQEQKASDIADKVTGRGVSDNFMGVSHHTAAYQSALEALQLKQKEGKDVYFHYFKAKELQMLDSRPETANGTQPNPAPQQGNFVPEAQDTPFDDDIPF